MAYQSFEDLEVWKRSVALAVQIYKIFEQCRDFALRDQMQRAAVSIPSNIAEGCERGGKDFQRFLRVSRGSVAELRTQVTIALQVGLISPHDAETTNLELVTLAKMLTRLDQSIGRKQP